MFKTYKGMKKMHDGTISGALRSLYAYPWDVAARGAREFAAELVDLGLTGVTLALAYHAGKFISPHHPSQRVVFPQDGVTYFTPAAQHYGEIVPQPHPDPALHNVAAQLADDGRLAVRAWIVLLHNSRLGERHPQQVACNAWGNPYVYSLCPSSPAVFDYAIQLSVDSARQAVTGLVLESLNWAPFAHGFHHEFAQVRGNLWLETLLGLCFCDACRARAVAVGIDATVLAARIRARVDGYLAAPVDADADQAASWLMADLLDMPLLADYLRLRQARVTELVAAIRDAVPRSCEVAVIPTVQRPTASSWLEGSHLAALAQVADALEVPFYEPSAARVAADAFDTVQRAGDVAKVRAILRPGPPDLAGGAELPAAITALLEAGIRDLSFYNYGLLRADRLRALGRAIRRESH